MGTLYELSNDMLMIERELEENGGELTPELEAALADTQESIRAKANGYWSLIAKLDDRCDAIDREIKRLQALKKATTNSRKRITDHILEVMVCFGLDKIEGHLCKFLWRKNLRLKCDQELLELPYRDRLEALKTQLPPWLTIDLTLNKTILKQSFKETDVLPAGCEFEESDSLTIR